MIHLENNKLNKLVFVETMPRIYVLYLKHKGSRHEYSIAAQNDIISSTETSLYLNDFEPGEYIYKLLYNNIVYETGIAKMIDKLPEPKQFKEYEKEPTITKFKMHKKE